MTVTATTSIQVERITGAAAVVVDDLLDPTSAPIQGIAGQADDVEGVHHRDRLGQFLGGRGLEAGEPAHCHDLHAVTSLSGAFGEPGLERGLGAALDHRMGHAQITTTQKYLHALPDAGEKNLTALDRIRSAPTRRRAGPAT
ncbi:hypothetical protein J2S59_003848 [Nocardioides massiliensis]|uniref:Phage integrase family protein n=1 Tax=Nocardioides massiliensis TaxID=1325935 RepID=A0ABT9NV66_9ACTN|nr:hypothetical protein [Nocardioides massiliensis]